MKNRFKMIYIASLAIIGLLACTAPPVQAQVDDAYLRTATNMPAIVTTTATSNFVSWARVYKDSGLALSWKFNQTSASTSNATLHVYSSLDGTNYSTVPFASLTAASTGATDVIANTNWSPMQLRGFHSLVIGSIANSTALTTLTNKGVTIRRPN
jgi:hypothetical protein